MADKLARRAFVILKTPTKGETRRINEMKDNLSEILAQEFTPEKETNLIGVPPSVMELLAAKKRRLLDEEQARIDASNSALRHATNFTTTLDPTLYTSKGYVTGQIPDGWKF